MTRVQQSFHRKVSNICLIVFTRLGACIHVCNKVSIVILNSLPDLVFFWDMVMSTDEHVYVRLTPGYVYMYTIVVATRCVYMCMYKTYTRFVFTFMHARVHEYTRLCVLQGACTRWSMPWKQSATPVHASVF